MSCFRIIIMTGLLLLLLACTDKATVAGTGSETETSLAGTVKTPEGDFISHARIQLFDVRGVDSIVFVSESWSDESGDFKLTTEFPIRGLIKAIDSKGGLKAQFLSNNLDSNQNVLESLILRPTIKLCATIPNPQGIQMFSIGQLDTASLIEGQFCLDNVTQGQLQLRYSKYCSMYLRVHTLKDSLNLGEIKFDESATQENNCEITDEKHLELNSDITIFSMINGELNPHYYYPFKILVDKKLIHSGLDMEKIKLNFFNTSNLYKNFLEGQFPGKFFETPIISFDSIDVSLYSVLSDEPTFIEPNFLNIIMTESGQSSFDWGRSIFLKDDTLLLQENSVVSAAILKSWLLYRGLPIVEDYVKGPWAKENAIAPNFVSTLNWDDNLTSWQQFSLNQNWNLKGTIDLMNFLILPREVVFSPIDKRGDVVKSILSDWSIELIEIDNPTVAVSVDEETSEFINLVEKGLSFNPKLLLNFQDELKYSQIKISFLKESIFEENYLTVFDISLWSNGSGNNSKLVSLSVDK